MEAALYAVLDEKPDADEHVATARELYEGAEHHVLDALLLVRADPELICDGLNLDRRVLDAYQALFFDVKVFRHAFAARRYVASLADGTEEYKAYELAIDEGPEALLDRYRLTEAPAADPIRTTQKLLGTFALRAREQKGRALTTRHAQEALKAGRAALEAASALRAMLPKNGGDTASLRFELALLAEDPTVPAAQAPVPLAELVRDGPPEDT